MLTLTPQHELLLRGSSERPVGVYQLQLATADQLTRIHYRSGTIKTVKARLKQLTDTGYLTSDTVPTRQFRSPYYYRLTDKALKHLAEQGFDTSEVAQPKGVQHGTLFIDHALELGDVLISAVLGGRLHSFRHEQTLKRRPYKATLPGGRMFTIVPDAFLDFRIGNVRYPILLEHDRGTEQQQYFRRRIAAYVNFLNSGEYSRLFGARSVTVAFTTFCGEGRRDQLRAWTRAELGTDPLGSLFSFASLARPPIPQCWLDACWHSPYDTVQPLLAA